MYVFIDELDRCRPNFAIEVLEVIKHIFDIEGVVFVVATNTNELQHSIKAVYGSGFDANKYLMRFFNRTYELPAPDLIDFLDYLPSFQYIVERIEQTNDLKVINWEGDIFINIASHLFNALNIDLRSTAQISDRVSSVLTMNPDEKGILWLLVLEALRVSLPDAYKKLVNGQLALTGSNSNSIQTEIFIPLMNNLKSKEYISSPYQVELHDKIYENDFAFQSRGNGTKSQKQFEKGVNIRNLITYIATHINKLQVSSHQRETILEWYMVKTHSDIKRFINYIEVASHLE